MSFVTNNRKRAVVICILHLLCCVPTQANVNGTSSYEYNPEGKYEVLNQNDQIIRSVFVIFYKIVLYMDTYVLRFGYLSNNDD